MENKNIELNVALHAFVILDGDGVRILERHPIDVISFASSGTEVRLLRSTRYICFISLFLFPLKPI